VAAFADAVAEFAALVADVPADDSEAADACSLASAAAAEAAAAEEDTLFDTGFHVPLWYAYMLPESVDS
jgi:hypothetical protein